MELGLIACWQHDHHTPPRFQRNDFFRVFFCGLPPNPASPSSRGKSGHVPTFVFPPEHLPAGGSDVAASINAHLLIDLPIDQHAAIPTGADSADGDVVRARPDADPLNPDNLLHTLTKEAAPEFSRAASPLCHHISSLSAARYSYAATPVNWSFNVSRVNFVRLCPERRRDVRIVLRIRHPQENPVRRCALLA